MQRRGFLKTTAAYFGALSLGACGGGMADLAASQGGVPAAPTSVGSSSSPVAPPPPPANLPYTLPAVGQAVAIGTNTANDVRPSGYSTSAWGYSLFNSYGSGAFVPDFSGAGAFVIAASGGHAAPGTVDAVVFDFVDARWKRVANANGITPREADYSTSETTGDPYYEIAGATAGQIPAPVHLYQTAVYIPSLLGGGAQGSYLKVSGGAATIESRQGRGIHRMDLRTGLWTRVTNDTTVSPSPVAVTVFDPVTKRYYFIHDAMHVENSLQYLDANDWRMKRTTTYAYPPDGTGYGWLTVFLDPVRRLLIAQRPGGFQVLALDLNNISAGWVALRTSGSPPAGHANRWAYYEPYDRFYTRGNSSGQVLNRLVPPSGDWKTGTWVFDTVTVGGAALPNYTTTGGEKPHDGAFFYVPLLQALAWVSGETQPVILLRPPA